MYPKQGAHVLLRRLHISSLFSFHLVFWLLVVDKDDITPDSSNVRTALRLGRVLEFGIREVPHKGRDLWSHSMLCFELGMRVILEDESFKKTPIEVEAFAFLDSKVEIIDLRTQLPEIESHDQVVECELGEWTYLWSPMSITC